MKIFLTGHAEQRAKERVISESLMVGMFRKALLAASRGQCKQYPDEVFKDRTKTVWKGWQFVHAPAKYVDDHGVKREGLVLITCFSTTMWHHLDGTATAKAPERKLKKDLHFVGVCV